MTSTGAYLSGIQTRRRGTGLKWYKLMVYFSENQSGSALIRGKSPLDTSVKIANICNLAEWVEVVASGDCPVCGFFSEHGDLCEECMDKQTEIGFELSEAG